MKLLNRDKKSFSYSTYSDRTEIMDGDLHTGEYTESYATAVSCKGVIRPNTKKVKYEVFGIDCNYDFVIYLDCNPPITETTLITIDSKDYIVNQVVKYHNLLVVGVSLKQ